MKKQMMSLILLTAVIGSTFSARAQSDVPDNMLQARSAVDILTNNELAKNPWDPCTDEELKNGCTKDLFPNGQFVQNFPIPQGARLEVLVLTNECNNAMEVELPNRYRIRLYAREYFNESGKYSTINQSRNYCTIQYKLVAK